MAALSRVLDVDVRGEPERQVHQVVVITSLHGGELEAADVREPLALVGLVVASPGA